MLHATCSFCARALELPSAIIRYRLGCAVAHVHPALLPKEAVVGNDQESASGRLRDTNRVLLRVLFSAEVV